MQESAPDRVARPRADLAVEPIDDDLVVLDRKLGRIHQLNATASLVWSGIAAGSSRRSIADSLVERYDVSPEVATKDVDAIVSQLETLNLLDSGCQESEKSGQCQSSGA